MNGGTRDMPSELPGFTTGKFEFFARNRVDALHPTEKREKKEGKR